MRIHLHLLISVALPTVAAAYGLDTHQILSDEATSRSILSQGTILQEWGFSTDVNSTSFPRSGDRVVLSISTLISAQGARDEDNGTRPFNHFLDPVNNAPLSTCLLGFVDHTSQDWAVYGKGQELYPPQEFSFSSARQAMFQAFTSIQKKDRDAGFGLLFETIGHVIHHIQDMAQPQHTRNDAHLELPGKVTVAGLSNPSRYESQTESDMDGSKIDLGSYPIVTLAAPTDYWMNAQGTGLAQFTNANFVSQGTNFQYSGDYFPNDKYRLPAPIGVEYSGIQTELTGKQQCPGDATCSLHGVVTFVKTYVTDNYPGGSSGPNNRAAMSSIFNQYLKLAGFPAITWSLCGEKSFSSGQLLTVNRLTFPQAQSFLIPAAIGYSTGMINYILRGKIDIVPHMPNGIWDGAYEFKNVGSEPISGGLQLYYDDADGNRHAVQGAGWPMTVNLTAAIASDPNDPDPPNSSDRIIIPQIPAEMSPQPAVPGLFMAVFNGIMGSEQRINNGPGAVVAKQVTIPVPKIYFSSFNVIDSSTGTGQLMLSFAMPPVSSPPGTYLLDSYFINTNSNPIDISNYLATHVKINGKDIPGNSVDTPQIGTCAPGSASYDAEGLAGTSGGNSWDWTYSTRNWTYWTPVDWTRTADRFLDVHNQDPNAIPDCATDLALAFASPQQATGIELLVGTRSIFKFCIRLDPSIPNSIGVVIESNLTAATAYISHMSGVDLMDQALGIFRDPNPPTSCPGL